MHGASTGATPRLRIVLKRDSNNTENSMHRMARSLSRNRFAFSRLSYPSQGLCDQDVKRSSSPARLSENVLRDKLVAILVKFIDHILVNSGSVLATEAPKADIKFYKENIFKNLFCKCRVEMFQPIFLYLDLSFSHYAFILYPVYEASFRFDAQISVMPVLLCCPSSFTVLFEEGGG